MKTTAGRIGTRGPGAVLALGLAWLLAAPLAAQTAPVGARVRVTAPEHMEQPCVGRVIESEDPLVVRQSTGTIREIPVRQVDLLEISRGRSHNSPQVLVGALAGIAVGAVAGYGSYDRRAGSCSTDEDPFCIGAAVEEAGSRVLRASIGGLAGGAVGGLAGYALTPERWVRLWARDAGAEIGIAPGGIVVRAGGSRRR